MSIEDYFDNNIALYITLGIAIVNILGYLGMASFSCVLIFILITYISSQIIDILSVDILIGLLISNIAFSCGRNKRRSSIIILYKLYIIMAFNVLTNKYVFYVLLVIGVANLLGYLAMEDYESLTLFVVIYALATYFSKNTIINLSAAILGTAIVRTPIRRKAWPWKEREGFEDKEDNETGPPRRKTR